MIQKLTPEGRTKYAKLIDYAKFLSEAINAKELVFSTSNFDGVKESLSYSRTDLHLQNVNTDLDKYLNNVKVDDLVLFIDENSTKQLSEKLKLLSKYIDSVPLVLISSNLSGQEFSALLKENNINQDFVSSHNNINFVLSGKYTRIKSVEKKKILAAVSTFNDEDIISQVLQHLLNQEVDVHVIDNWSTDNTAKFIEEFAKENPNRIFITKFPEKPSDKFMWKETLNLKATANINKDYDWIIHYDSDEIRISPWLNSNIQDSISFVDSLGFNAIDFTVLNFEATRDGFSNSDNPEEFFSHFDFGRNAGHTLQIKAWKNLKQEVDLSFHFGHEVLFEGRKVYPLNFLLKHYPLRSSTQSKRKIFEERKPRYNNATEGGAHNHYNNITENSDFIKSEKDLFLYKNDTDFYKQFLIEATTRITTRQPDKAAVILGFVREQNEGLLIEAIKRVYEQSHREFDIFVYDNSEKENSLALTKSLFPRVYIKKNVKNCGFAGGNNSVMREVLKSGAYDYVVLLNDDTQVTQDWLKSLIELAKESKDYGAVTSKLLFYEPYVRLSAVTQTFNPKEVGIGEDTRNLGIKFYLGECRFEHTHYIKKFMREGFYGMEGDYSWTDKTFVIDLPIGSVKLDKDYELVLSIESPEQIENHTIKISIGDFKQSLELKTGKKNYVVNIPGEVIEEHKFDLIQNASSGITAQFNGYDIGSLNGNAEIDEGQYDQIKEAEMICGGAVLFKAETLQNVGIFDEYFFVYYEDSDLSLRIRHAGYKLMYQPKAVVRHIHAGSSTEYSPLFTYHVWKNKPAFVIKNFGIRPSLYALAELTKIELRELKDALRFKFRNGYHNSRLKVILKSSVTFYRNLPVILLKKFNVIKSV